MNSLRIAKSLFLKDNPHLVRNAHIPEAPEWLQRCIEKEEVFIPHFYASEDEVISAFTLNGKNIILNMERSAIRKYIDSLLGEIEILFPESKEIICIGAEFLEHPSCHRRIYRYQSPLSPCIPPLPPFREFYSERIPFELDQFIWRLEHLYDIREKEALLSLIFFLLENNGREFNYRKTAALLDMRFETLKTFLGYLERAFFVRILESREGGPKSRRISLITDWRMINHLMNRQPLEIFLSSVEPAAVYSYNFLRNVSGGKVPCLEDIVVEEGDSPPT